MKKNTFTKNRSVSASFIGLVLIIIGVYLAFVVVASFTIGGSIGWAEITLAFGSIIMLLVGFTALITRSWNFIKAVATSIFNFSE